MAKTKLFLVWFGGQPPKALRFLAAENQTIGGHQTKFWMVLAKFRQNGFLVILYVGRNASPAILGPSGAPPRSPRAFPENSRKLLGDPPGPAMGLPGDPQAPSGISQELLGRPRGAPRASPGTLGTLQGCLRRCPEAARASWRPPGCSREPPGESPRPPRSVLGVLQGVAWGPRAVERGALGEDIPQ